MTYRVIQWATGAMGKSCLRAVLDRPDMELVGLFVYGDAKAGRDAGEIARRAPVGVVATQDMDAILALDADIVLHCARLAPPYGSHDREIAALLASGKNVISINGYSDPGSGEGVRVRALEAACRAGGATLMGAGLNPGLAAEQLAVVASGACADVRSIEIAECVDCRTVRNPTYVFEVLGFGADCAAVNPNDPEWGPAASLNGMYAEVLSATAAHLGFAVAGIETSHRVLPATRDLVVAAGPIAAGRVAHVNWRWTAHCHGGRSLVMSIHWYMEEAHLPEPDPPLWRIRINGRPNVRIAVDLGKPDGDVSATSAEQLGLAGAVVNAIPVVCAAAPGLLRRPIATPFRADAFPSLA